MPQFCGAGLNLRSPTHLRSSGCLKLEKILSPVSGSPQGKVRSPGPLQSVILSVCLSATFIKASGTRMHLSDMVMPRTGSGRIQPSHSRGTYHRIRSRQHGSCTSTGLGLRLLSLCLFAETFFGVMSHPGAWNPAALPWSPWGVRPRAHVNEIQAPSLLNMGEWKDPPVGNQYLSQLLCLSLGTSVISHIKCRG